MIGIFIILVIVITLVKCAETDFFTNCGQVVQEVSNFFGHMWGNFMNKITEIRTKNKK